MENLGFGLEIMVVGFLIVMIALLTLALILKIFEKVLAPQKKQKPAATKAAATPSATSPVSKSAGGQKEEEDEVVAAIAASLSLFLEKPFRIHRIAPSTGGEQNRWLWAHRARSVQSSRELVFYRRRKNR